MDKLKEAVTSETFDFRCFICPLELGTEYNLKGIKVTLLDANHCPGAALIHFRLPNGQSYLHTGDFRASKLMQSYPLLASQRINIFYLDTTYCNPKYRFPSKEDVLEFVVGVTRRYLNNHPKTIVVVGAYIIGKEHVYLAISKALGRYLTSQDGHYTSMLAFRPTGVPYSEHSSFTELQEFVQFLRPEKIIPTVNVGNAVNRGKMQSHF
ncbi:hypothetical protein K7X08_019062 [Anisodus acutangulus]|uniref:DNA repair metallo-beta-lactamase domain-containing protein n=1 Tax=Anisodus acutangulus TaxID=402998 RepID=A0A9Q1R7U5_9SOLA|nr:hypothetical protein K7X08_019062 [Anisodus acutangulus]